jgi:tetratricopeptide (TPR) repeat protein
MKKSLKLLSVAIVFAALLCAPLKAQSNNHAAARLSPAEVEKWRQDLRYLAEEMPRRHRDLFHAMTREQFEAAVKRLDEKIPTLARYQLIVELQRLVAMVGDGHTSIQGIPFDSKIDFHSYPLTLYLYKDGLFVQSADAKYAEAVGARVVKIGNATAEEALRAAHDLVFHDNEQAIEIFKLNVEAFPQSANTYDSLGEAYLNAGNNELAIKNYEKAFELDPTNTNAAQVVKRLKGK